MATPAEVVESLAGLREGSAFARARSAAETFRAFASLSTEQKRDLAVLVAERSAPHLVPRIEAETGLDLSREQVQAVIDMAGRLDAEDLDDLAHTVRDREARGEALRTVATSAAVATGLDEVATPEPAPPTEPALDEDADPPVSLTEPAPSPEPAPEVGTDAEVIELDHEPEPTVEVAPAPEPREFTSIFDTLDTPDWDAPRTVEVVPRTAPTPTDEPEPAVPDTVDLTTRVRATRLPLVERLRGAATNAERMRLLRSRLDEVSAMDPVARAAVVDAVPDGWARRRALDTMVEEGGITVEELPGLVRRLDSPMARSWVCATAIEADLLDVHGLDGLLDDRAVDRLRRRYA